MSSKSTTLKGFRAPKSAKNTLCISYRLSRVSICVTQLRCMCCTFILFKRLVKTQKVSIHECLSSTSIFLKILRLSQSSALEDRKSNV